jgi:hypothetical protein
MAGRYEGYHFLRDENEELYLRFEVFWQHSGWFWRPLLTLDGKTVGPFTKSTEAYRHAVALAPRGDQAVDGAGDEAVGKAEGEGSLTNCYLVALEALRNNGS